MSSKRVTSASHLRLLNELVGSQKPPDLYNLRHIIDELDDNAEDFAYELEMVSLKEKVVSIIRQNREYERKIEEADRRIGSLVRNYQMITNKKLLHQLKEEAFETDHRLKESKDHGLSEFSLEGRKKLRSYEHFIFLLQTEPKYLSFMIVHDKGSAITMHKHLLGELFGFITTPREGYLMLKIFEASLKEEIKSKIDDPTEFVRGNPRIIAMAIDFYRSCCFTSLFSSIQPLLVETIHAKYSNLSLDPIIIYKDLMKEANKNMKQDITPKEALSVPGVQERLQHGVNNLIKVCDRFIDIFCSEEFIEEIEFGIRYLSRCLWENLLEKFPRTEKRQLLKVIAHVVYKRFIGNCILVPDEYGIIKLRAGESIDHDSRTNLRSICNLLIAAATGQKSFSACNDITDIYQNLALTQFLRDGHERFKEFFRQFMVVETPEDYYEINQFTDDASICPPQVNIKLSELILLHQRVHEQRQMLCPSSSDPLSKVLDELGPPPFTVAISSESANDKDLGRITLTLKNPKSTSLSHDEVETVKAIKVKQAIIELIKQRPRCPDLHEVFFSKIEPKESQSYLLMKQHLSGKVSNDFKKQSVLFSTHGESLSTLLDFVLLNIKVINAPNFDVIARHILDDLKMKIENRERFRSEVERLKWTHQMLEDKREHNAKVLESYKNYINKCLDNLREASNYHMERTSKKIACLKYTALKLHSKGILIDLEGVERKKWKDAVFQIRPLPSEVGLFQIRLLFKTMEVACIKLELQYLLELQFKNQTEIEIMDKAKINVILLLYLLDKKFYSAWD